MNKIMNWVQFEEKSCTKNDNGEELPKSKTKRTKNTSIDDDYIEVVDKAGKKTKVPNIKSAKNEGSKIASFGEFLLESDEPKSEVQAEVREEEKVMKEKKPKAYNKYQLFFKEKLKKYGATGIGSLGDKRGQFFQEIKRDWAKEKAKVQAQVQD